jgi:hypothetical protein
MSKPTEADCRAVVLQYHRWHGRYPFPMPGERTNMGRILRAAERRGWVRISQDFIHRRQYASWETFCAITPEGERVMASWLTAKAS